jgi:hypothetical protein
VIERPHDTQVWHHSPTMMPASEAPHNPLLIQLAGRPASRPTSHVGVAWSVTLAVPVITAQAVHVPCGPIHLNRVQVTTCDCRCSLHSGSSCKSALMPPQPCPKPTHRRSRHCRRPPTTAADSSSRKAATARSVAALHTLHTCLQPAVARPGAG